MRVFKNKSFARFARKVQMTDAVLCAAIADASRGLVDADLGGGVVKQRVARQGVRTRKCTLCPSRANESATRTRVGSIYGDFAFARAS